MDSANLRLSQEEMDLISRTDWILTKNRLIQKIQDYLGQLCEVQKNAWSKSRRVLPAEVVKIPSKISRGENYQGLPWLMLDYPRYFTTNDQLAIRTFFWWGDSISVILHTQGIYKQQWAPLIMQHKNKLAAANWLLCTGEDPWAHHYHPDNYKALASIGQTQLQEIADSRSFLKIAWRLPFPEAAENRSLLEEAYIMLVNLWETGPTDH